MTAAIRSTERAELKEKYMTSLATHHRIAVRTFIVREIQHVDD
ncbi:hypothetical protein [Rhodopseudomonas palustris]|nr:hypothetical protein [Rhodopseudomonas palustris]